MTATRFLPYLCPRCKAEYGDPVPACCSRCASFLWRKPDGWAGHDLNQGPRKIRVVSVADLAVKRWETRTAGPRWAELLGRVEIPKSLSIGICGMPGSGKSTFAVALAEDGTCKRPLLIAGEEGLSQSVAERLARAEARRMQITDATVLPEALEAIDVANADLVIVDSVNALSWSVGEVAALRAAKPNVTVIHIHQFTKGGVFAGSMEWMHLSDLWIEVDAFKWTTVKSWHGKTGLTGEV